LATPGLSSAGFVAEALADILTDIQNALRAQFGQDIDLDPRGPFGQFAGIMAERESTLWQLAGGVYAAAYPDTASGNQLDDVCSVTGAIRLGATPSQVSIVAIGTNGTPIPSGALLATAPNAVQFQVAAPVTIATLPSWAATTGYSAFAALAVGALVTNDTAKIYACIAAGTSAGSGGPTGTGLTIVDGSCTWRYVGTGTAAGGALCVAVETGPTTSASGTLTTISSPVSGFSSCVNPVDAAPGRNLETDAALRLRRAQLLQAEGSAPVLAIRSALLNVAGVTSCTVYPNNTDTIDGAGRPPHSVECVVLGGTDIAVALAIFDAVAAGINTVGTSSQSVTDPTTGVVYSIGFTRPTLVPIYIALTLKKGATYPATGGMAAVAQAIVNFAAGLDAAIPGSALFAVGGTVYSGPLAASVFDQVAGVLDIPTCNIGTSASPGTSTPLAMTYKQLPQFETANIIVTET